MKPLLFLILVLSLPLTSKASELKIYSNGNLKPILMEISHFYQTRNPDWKVLIESGKVSEIKEKLEAGAAGDLLLGEDKLFEMAEEMKAFDTGSRSLLFANPVVAVADVDSEIQLSDPKEISADNFKKIALVGEKTPLGKLVRAYLEPKGLKNAPAEKKIQVADAKAALEAVKTGEAKWTLVYSTDASKRKVKRLFQIPSTDIPETSFSVAVLNRSQNKEQAAKFIEALKSTIAQKFFENAGFIWNTSPQQVVSTQTKKKPQTQTQTQPQPQSQPQTQTKPQSKDKSESSTQTKPQQKKKKKKKKKDQDKAVEIGRVTLALMRMQSF